MLSKRFMFLSLLATVAMAIGLFVACGGGDDDDDDNDTATGDDTAAFVPVGNCTTQGIFDAIDFITSCYTIPDPDTQAEMTTDQICANLDVDQFNCFVACADAGTGQCDTNLDTCMGPDGCGLTIN